MRVIEVLKDIAFGAGVASLKLAGSVAFPGAWPIIEGALDPVIDRVKKSLGVEDPLDEKNAETAWSKMLTDDALGGVFEAKLELAVAPLRTSQQELEEGERRLLQILAGNADILRLIKEDLNEMQRSGVTVAQSSIDAIGTAVGEQFAERMRALEQRLEQLVVRHANTERDQKIRSRFKSQLARTQARAVELLNGREFDRAADELRSGIESLQLLIEEAPDNVDLRVNLGYYYKTIAATFGSIDGDKIPASVDQAKVVDEFNERAMRIFYFVAHGIPLDRKTARDHAHAINGVGNIHYARGRHRLAIENYELATRIDPYYCYAWHDLFGAYEALAQGGDVNFPAMRRALDRTRETGQGQPGLGARRLQELEHRLSAFDPDAVAGRLIEEALKPLEDLREIAKHPLLEPSSTVEDEVLNRALRALRRGATEPAREMLAGLVDDFDRGRSQDARRTAAALCHLGSIVARTDAEAAHRRYARAVELAPAWADAWHDLGAILTHLDRPREAASAFLRGAIQAQASGQRSLLLLALENTAQALSAEAATVAVGIRMLRGLLYAYHSTGDRRALLRVYGKLVELDIAFQNPQEAEHFAKIALRLAGDSPVEKAKFEWTLALFAEAREDRADALAHYQRAQLLLEETGPEELIQRAAAKVKELA